METTATSFLLPPKASQGARGDALWQRAPLPGSIALVNQRHPRPQKDIGQQDLVRRQGGRHGSHGKIWGSGDPYRNFERVMIFGDFIWEC